MKSGEFIEKIGRRKTSSARVRIFQGAGTSTINNKPASEYAETALRKIRLNKPFAALNVKEGVDYYFTALAKGGGKAGQIDAVVLGLARSFVALDEANKTILKKEGLMTRDPRMVESKKVFLVKARKRPQYSKR